MAKHLNVNLAFTADTAKAKSQMQDLQHTLNDLVMQPSKFGVELTEELTKATQAAARLSVQLKDATNVDTGTLDFGKLNESMRKSGQTLSSYGDTLMKLGPQGQEAFLKVTQAVAKAEVPIRRSNKLVTELWTTLKNTARWQISSSILHSFMGALQSAYGYAQDLNASLNDIRIVTGANADEMAKFADQANKAARELSATTNEYAKASLIYFQQGLSGKEVEERTNVTIKMAKVTRDSAQEVSNQLTAIWNNFDNGTQSLEYYADAITALGAATASSTDEIAEGLEKFAAIANTVGLSYEYATSALATVTAETRQSADVVGTAFKTLFARLQDLELGKTLDDGTDLGKYSAALDAVGINIKDTSGELKSMDQIIDELGKKWNTLGKDTQIALAQTVAGTRQYTQLVALMDNYDVFERNLQTVKNSSGALEKQHKVYEEGWEAAADRVQAALEKVYATILDDDAFIGLLNGIEKMVVGVDHLIDAFGGLGGTLSFIGALATRIFSTQLTKTVSDLMYALKSKDSIQQDKFNQLDGARAKFDEHATLNYGADSEVGKAVKQVYAEQIELQKTLIANEHKFNEEEQKTLQILLDQNEALSEQYIQAQKNKEASKSKVDSLSNKLLVSSAENKGESFDRKAANTAVDQLRAYAQAMGELSKKTPSIANIQDHLAKLKELGVPDTEIKKLRNELDQIDESSEDAAKAFSEFKISLAQMGKDIMDGTDNIEVDRKVREEYIKAVEEDVVAQDAAAEAHRRFEQGCKNTTKVIEAGGQVTVDWAQKIVQTAGVIMQVTGAINALHNAWETLKDPDVSGWEKFTTVLNTLVIVIPTVLATIKAVKEILDSETKVTIASALAKFFKAKSSRDAAKASREEASASREARDAQVQETASDVADEVVNKAQSKGSGKFGKHGNRTFSGKYDAKNRPLDNNGQVIGKKYYSKAGLDGNGKQIPKTSTPKPPPAAGNAGGAVGGGAVSTAAPAAAGNGSWVAGMGSPAVSAAASLGIFLAGIAVLAGTVAAVVWQMNKAERALDKAKEAASQLQENYDSVKASYDSLMSGASAYKDAANNVNELTKGTTAYKEAVLQANEAASQLLSTNKDLKYTIEDGQIVIDEESLEAAQEKSLKNVELAQAANMAGQAQLRQAEENLAKRDMARKLNSGGDAKQKAGNGIAGGILGGVGAGLATGAAVGAIAGGGVFSVPAALIGGAVGMITGGVIGAVTATSTKEENAALEKIEAAALKDETIIEKIRQGDMSDTDWKNIGIDDTKLIASLNGTGEAVADLIDEMVANTAAINAQNDLVASNALANNEAVAESEYKDQIVDIAGDAYGIAYDKALKSDWTDTWGKKGIAQINGANKEAKKVFDEYLKYAGLEGQGYTLTDTTGNDKNRKFVYKDKEGNEHTVSLEAMQAARAAYEASETLDKTAVNLAATFDKLASSGDKADQALLSFVSGKNFEGASKSEFEAMSSAVTDANGNVDKNEVKTYLEENLGQSLTDDVAAQYGYESANAMIDAFAKQLEDAETAWSEIQIPSTLGQNIADNLSLATAGALEKQVEKMDLGPLGEKAGQTYAAGLTKMLEGLDPDEQQDALAKLTEIDWSSWDALEQADAIMKEFGVEIDTSSQYWQNFADEMRLANGATPDYSKLKTDLNEISRILQSLDFGSVISDEDYQRLVAYNDEWERYFQLQADGSRRFIGNSDDMLQQTRDDINNRRQELQKRLDAQTGFINANWGHQDENGKWVKADWENKTGDDIGSAKNLLNAKGATQDMLTILGYDDKTLSSIITEAENGSEKAKKRLEEMYQRIADFQTEDLGSQQKELNEMMASTATSIDELNEMQKKGLVGSKWGKNGEVTAYEKQLKYLTTTALNSAESLEELNAAWSKNSSVKDAKVDVEVYRENLQRLAEQYSTASEELEAYQKAIESNDTKAIRAAENTLKNAIKLGEAAAQYGVNADELEKLTREMMDSSRMGFDAAMKTAIGYMTLAEELGISVEELQNTLAVLTTSFDGLRAAEIDALFTQISDKAKELGVSVTELAEQVASLGTQFGVSGEDALEMATLFSQANSDLGVSNDELIIQTQNIASEFDLSAKAAAKLAVENQRMNKGVATLTENWQDWKHTLTTASKTSTDYAKAMGELTQVVRDLTGAGDDFVMTSEFLEDNMKLIEQAANGDAKAINLLGVATAKATVSAMAFDAELMESMREAANRTGDFSAFNNMSRSFEQNKSIVQSGINDLMDAVANGTIKVGDSMSVLGDDWISALNEMALQTGMSVEEMNSLLNQMGVSADVTVTEVPTMTRVPVYRTEEQVIPDESGQGLKITETKTSVARYEDMEGTIQVASVNADANVTYTGNGSVSTSSKTSGGGSTKKPTKEQKKQTKERYMKVTEQLDDTANAMGDANREMDSLYGAGRIAKMSQVNKLLGDEVKLLEAKTQEAKEYLKEDKKAMEDAFADAGVTKKLEFDANGNVSNIENILGGLDAEYNKLVDDYNRKAKNAWDNDGVISGNEQKSLDALKERMDEKAAEIDAAKAAYDQYADTLNVIAETEDQILEKQNEVRANNYQKMVDNLNLALEGTTAETQEIDYYLNKIADDFYKMSEAAALTESKMGVATEVLALQKQHADGLASAYAKGNITQADYVAGLGETRDAIYGELESLQSLDKEMQDYYGNTLSAAGEELDKYTERMDHLNSVLDHYQSLLGIIGQETDYKAMGIVLQGIADGAENSLAVAKAEYAFYAGEAEKKKALMESVPKDSAAFEQYKKEWEAAEAASREAQDNMLSATAEWAEAMKSVLTNELSDFASTLEKQLTGGTSFDEMTTSIERAASLQEDYLTTTNQIYETTKMMRVAEKALDETTSTAAKNKLKGFLESTKQLQNQEKLSKFELDMQQKKYDLLLAEIALEEAQNAKSTVRLQRNAEGGFGYVYTADANQVADAQQKVDDAENALYNAGLEGANDFAQKQAQIAKEGQDAIQSLTDALANGEISLEDWQRRTAETQAHYAQKLQDYSDLYQVAISADSVIMQEAWAADFATMITDAETWSTSMDEYLANCEGSFQKWQETVAEVQNVVGSNYEEIAENVGAITDANDELTEEILAEGGVIETIGAEVTAVSNATEAYAAKRQAVLDLIETNENYIKSLNAIIAAESGTAIVGDTSDDVPTVTTPSGFDTGGYTGEWGPSGKLAVLHEKEIVLNATDTQNLLSIVEMLRTIDMHSLSAQIGGILSTPGFHGGDGGTLEQNVKIEASFPNVQDRNEIEEAFNNLINRASQYANRG